MIVLKMCGSEATAQMRLVMLFEGSKSFITWAFSVIINLSLMLRFHLVYRPGELATFEINSASRSYCLARLRHRKRLQPCHSFWESHALIHDSKSAPRLCEAFCEVAALQLSLHRPFAQLAGRLVICLLITRNTFILAFSVCTTSLHEKIFFNMTIPMNPFKLCLCSTEFGKARWSV